MKEWSLLLVSVIATLVLATGVIRWLAPGLLGIARDLQLVQIDDRKPPFYQGVFDNSDTPPGEFLIRDPVTRIRARPLFRRARGGGQGPNDILGFRNRSVPNTADIIALGDSMTYGNNALMEQTWPGHLRQTLAREDISVYSMASSGWAAVQYLDMMKHAVLFDPHVVVVAFYTGNDPLESFQMTYASDYWNWLIPDSTLSSSDLPKVNFPPPESEQWDVTFRDGVHAVFTPKLRLASNDSSPVVRAGYRRMEKSARLMADMAQQVGCEILFTIIPTKELVYALKVRDESIAPPADYQRLVTQEREYIRIFSNTLGNIEGARYIDVAEPLQRAAMGNVNLYPDNSNSHPVAEGYRVIGEEISKHVKALVPPTLKGLYAWNDEEKAYIVLIKNEGVWIFSSIELVRKNGWPEGDLQVISSRELSNLPYRGFINTVDSSRFGPDCCHTSAEERTIQATRTPNLNGR